MKRNSFFILDQQSQSTAGSQEIHFHWCRVETEVDQATESTSLLEVDQQTKFTIQQAYIVCARVIP